jgi:hypothetical protein
MHRPPFAPRKIPGTHSGVFCVLFSPINTGVVLLSLLFLCALLEYMLPCRCSSRVYVTQKTRMTQEGRARKDKEL